jgi:hypothetical protein
MNVEHIIPAKSSGKKSAFISVSIVSLLFISVAGGAFYLGKSNQNSVQPETLSATSVATPVVTITPAQPTIPPSPQLVTSTPSPTGKPPSSVNTPTPKVTPAIP